MLTSVASIFLFAAFLTPGLAKPTCPLGPGMRWLADPNDCSLFYVCHGSQRFDFSCGDNVWDPDTKTCVGRGSLWDKCECAASLCRLLWFFFCWFFFFKICSFSSISSSCSSSCSSCSCSSCCSSSFALLLVLLLFFFFPCFFFFLL